MSRRTLVFTMLGCGGWYLASSWTTMSPSAEYACVLECGMWIAACGSVLLLRPLWMKTTLSGSGRLGDDPRQTCHKDSVSSPSTGRLIGAQSSMVCNGVLPDLGGKIAHVFLRQCHGGGGDRRWAMVRLVIWISKTLGPLFISWSDHMCTLYNLFV